MPERLPPTPVHSNAGKRNHPNRFCTLKDPMGLITQALSRPRLARIFNTNRFEVETETLLLSEPRFSAALQRERRSVPVDHSS